MRFLVDAQLPPSLAKALRVAGHEAFHVADFGLLDATDQPIWEMALETSAILVTKDQDFLLLRTARGNGPVILWIRLGNCPNRVLISQLTQALPAIIDAVNRGEAVIEFVAR